MVPGRSAQGDGGEEDEEGVRKQATARGF